MCFKTLSQWSHLHCQHNKTHLHKILMYKQNFGYCYRILLLDFSAVVPKDSQGLHVLVTLMNVHRLHVLMAAALMV